ncbi:GAF domain-containing protein [Cryobacterium cryoconiti]|uniref:GAF domain-containing protein n=1 Tax=Cryobacterium cryoconiti TaxID=1259239 RepID=A0A4Y8JUN9_9MICO|nr:GAF domain-containing protein [Cryobacterium cryoconiti]TFD28238.1 GAF domain-containing protein [Cryobacterium cryoconiti]
MPEFLRWALVPLMRALSAAVSRDYGDVPRPRDSPQAHSPGNDSDRILIFGNGPAAGWGVLSHDVALPGSLARALSVRTGRGTDVDVIPNPQVTIRTAQAELDGVGLWRYDAVVVSVGTSDAITLLSARVWRRELSALLDRIERESSLNTRIFVLGVQPIRSIAAFDSALGAVAGKHARRLNAASAALCGERAQSHFIPMGANLSPTPGRVRTSAHYTRWAEALADRMAPALDADHLDSGRAAAEVRAVERGAEQLSPGPRRAVDRLTGIGTAAEVACDRLVALARSTYGTSSAALTFVDGDRLWDMVHLGFTPRVYPLAGSITARAVSGAGAFVVSDALLDDRFAARPPEAGQAVTRFYAGFPIEADSGERIGVLCVFDTKPRRRNEVDTVLLRELALSIQAELSERSE